MINVNKIRTIQEIANIYHFIDHCHWVMIMIMMMMRRMRMRAVTIRVAIIREEIT